MSKYSPNDIVRIKREIDSARNELVFVLREKEKVSKDFELFKTKVESEKSEILSKLEAKKETIQPTIDKLIAECSSLKILNSDLGKKIVDKQKTLNSIISDIEDSDTLLKVKSNKIDSLNNSIESLSAKEGELKLKFKTSENTYNQLEKSIVSLNKEKEKLSESNKILLSDIGENHSKKNLIASDIKKLSIERKKAEIEIGNIEKLKSMSSELDISIKKDTLRLKNIQLEIDKFDKKLDEKKTLFKNEQLYYQKENDLLNKSLVNLKEQITRSKSELSSLVNERDNTKSETIDILDSLKKSKSNLLTSIESLTYDFEKLTSDFEESKIVLEEELSLIKKSNLSDKEKLSSELFTIKEKIKQLDSIRESKNDLIHQLNIDIEELTKSLSNLNKNHSDNLSKKVELEQNLSILSREKGQILSDISSMKNTIEQSKISLSIIESKHKEIKKRLETKQAMLNLAERKLSNNT